MRRKLLKDQGVCETVNHRVGGSSLSGEPIKTAT